MQPDLKTIPNSAIGHWGLERLNSTESIPEIMVLLTSFEPTQAALKRAGTLTLRRGAEIALVAVQVVPYPLPLDKPPVPLRFIIRRFDEVISQSPVKTEIRVFLCRDQMEALKRVLTPHCPIVLGTRKKWWPTHEKRLASKLRRAGHEVILVETE